MIQDPYAQVLNQIFLIFYKPKYNTLMLKVQVFNAQNLKTTLFIYLNLTKYNNRCFSRLFKLLVSTRLIFAWWGLGVFMCFMCGFGIRSFVCEHRYVFVVVLDSVKVIFVHLLCLGNDFRSF